LLRQGRARAHDTDKFIPADLVLLPMGFPRTRETDSDPARREGRRAPQRVGPNWTKMTSVPASPRQETWRGA